MTENDFKENNPVFVEKSFSSVTFTHKIMAPNLFRVCEVGEWTGVSSKFISITVLDFSLVHFILILRSVPSIKLYPDDI